jgi:hypothetical protein
MFNRMHKRRIKVRRMSKRDLKFIICSMKFKDLKKLIKRIYHLSQAVLIKKTFRNKVSKVCILIAA